MKYMASMWTQILLTMMKIRHKIQVIATNVKAILKKTEKNSLTKEIAFIISGLVVGTVALCWLLNTVFLERYYVFNKQSILENGFGVMDDASKAGKLESSEFDITFDNLCANGNIIVLIINSDSTVVRTSVNNPRQMLIEFMDIIFGRQDETATMLAREDNYVIQRRTDTRLDSEYLVLYGTLSNGNMILMRSALESIRESVKISNQFLLYIGILAIAVSLIIVIFVSQRVTKPILELTDLSKRMTELDFEAKYDSRHRRRNEIDELGVHMNELSQTLESTISELKSANNQLLIDIEKKTQIDQMRKEFLSNVSHELKTPLALIQGYAEGLRECINDDEESRNFYCEVIIDEAEKMNLMVKKLLTLNHLECGGENVMMERFDLTELITGLLHSIDILLEQNGIVIEESPSAPLYVWADEFMTEEVLTNYLSNAIHHAKGEKKISVRYQMKGSLVRVIVYNTGDPIPFEDIDKIWNKFYKVDKAHTREYGGSGIGLSIVKAIMDSFHRECGMVNCEKGVEFWFELDMGKS